ncbi:dimethylaniline monooxygenase [Ophiocordyceps sinensis CO18]|uniref:Dimethylaniline monooxygenase n=1 Tax=Ophiocordyceps sinensis (strain Co18 / CGMCC 3.14243) TaxID=911162 RepID=T5AL14_OPHSC|nr:dimethylaniline monooxygenase [Ophiocordyceps sinensis CO18]
MDSPSQVLSRGMTWPVSRTFLKDAGLATAYMPLLLSRLADPFTLNLSPVREPVEMKVAVIGGGPSGIVTLKYLVEAHQSLQSEKMEVWLFEYQPQIGGAFAARVYEDAELVSSKQLTTFSDFRYGGPQDFLSPEHIGC